MAKLYYDSKKTEASLDSLELAKKDLNLTANELRSEISKIKSARGAEYIDADYSWPLELPSACQDAIDSTCQTISSNAEKIEKYNKEVGDMPFIARYFLTKLRVSLALDEGIATAGEQIIDGCASAVGFIAGKFGSEKTKNKMANFIKKDHVGDWFDKQYKKGDKSLLGIVNKYSYISSEGTACKVLKWGGVAVGYIGVVVATGGAAGAVAGAAAGTGVAAGAAAGATTAMGSLGANMAVAGLGGLGGKTQSSLQEGKSFDKSFKEGVKAGVVQAGTVAVLHVAGKAVGSKISSMKAAKAAKSGETGTALEVLDVEGSTASKTSGFESGAKEAGSFESGAKAGKASFEGSSATKIGEGSIENNIDDVIKNADDQFKELSQQYAEGKISKAEFRARAKELHSDNIRYKQAQADGTAAANEKLDAANAAKRAETAKTSSSETVKVNNDVKVNTEAKASTVTEKAELSTATEAKTANVSKNTLPSEKVETLSAEPKVVETKPVTTTEPKTSVTTVERINSTGTEKGGIEVVQAAETPKTSAPKLQPEVKASSGASKTVLAEETTTRVRPKILDNHKPDLPSAKTSSTELSSGSKPSTTLADASKNEVSTNAVGVKQPTPTIADTSTEIPMIEQKNQLPSVSKETPVELLDDSLNEYVEYVNPKPTIPITNSKRTPEAIPSVKPNITPTPKASIVDSTPKTNTPKTPDPIPNNNSSTGGSTSTPKPNPTPSTGSSSTTPSTSPIKPTSTTTPSTPPSTTSTPKPTRDVPTPESITPDPISIDPTPITTPEPINDNPIPSDNIINDGNSYIDNSSSYISPKTGSSGVPIPNTGIENKKGILDTIIPVGLGIGTVAAGAKVASDYIDYKEDKDKDEEEEDN